MLTIKIITPAGQAAIDMLDLQIRWLEAQGFRVEIQTATQDPNWTYTAGSISERAKILTNAVLDTNVDILMSGRGGYGCSDLLTSLPWETFKSLRKKLIVGFSDVSALHSAFYTKLGWHSLHAPMPATSLWRKDGDDDVLSELASIKAYCSDTEVRGQLAVKPVGHDGKLTVSGRLFGGCFTVLSNLIGTPFIPKSLAGHIVFIEDTDENPARLMRAANQWVQSGILNDAHAVVIGHLRNLGEKIPDCADYVYQEFARRFPVPVFKTDQFGHTSPNYPLLIGADASIESNQLIWHHNASIA